MLRPTGARCCQRRNNREPVEHGGWSCFVTGWAGLDWKDPAGHIAMRGNGDAGYPGWSTSPRLNPCARTGCWRAAFLPSRRSAATCRTLACRTCRSGRSAQYIQPTANRTSVTDFSTASRRLEHPAGLSRREGQVLPWPSPCQTGRVPHQSAMNAAIASVVCFSLGRFARSSKPWLAIAERAVAEPGMP